MIETNTTQKDWDDFWESVNEDQSIPTERELFESNDDDKSLTNVMWMMYFLERTTSANGITSF